MIENVVLQPQKIIDLINSSFRAEKDSNGEVRPIEPAIRLYVDVDWDTDIILDPLTGKWHIRTHLQCENHRDHPSFSTLEEAINNLAESGYSSVIPTYHQGDREFNDEGIDVDGAA
jgi:hypothetical protein